MLITTIAGPGQLGTHHVTLKTASYWDGMFLLF